MNSEQAKYASLSFVLCATVYRHNMKALCNRYCSLTGMATYVIWNVEEHDPTVELTLMDQGQMNCLKLDKSKYLPVYCSDQPGNLLVPNELFNLSPLGFGSVRNTHDERIGLLAEYHQRRASYQHEH